MNQYTKTIRNLHSAFKSICHRTDNTRTHFPRLCRRICTAFPPPRLASQIVVHFHAELARSFHTQETAPLFWPETVERRKGSDNDRFFSNIPAANHMQDTSAVFYQLPLSWVECLLWRKTFIRGSWLGVRDFIMRISERWMWIEQKILEKM